MPREEERRRRGRNMENSRCSGPGSASDPLSMTLCITPGRSNIQPFQPVPPTIHSDVCASLPPHSQKQGAACSKSVSIRGLPIPLCFLSSCFLPRTGIFGCTSAADGSVQASLVSGASGPGPVGILSGCSQSHSAGLFSGSVTL